MAAVSVLLAASLLTIAPGHAIEQTLASGETTVLLVPAVAGQFVQINVEQRDTNLVVVVLGPGDDRAIVATRDGRERGPEPVSFIADRSGTYRLEIRSVVPRAASSSFRVHFEGARPATAADSRIVDAEAAATDAAEAFRKGDRPSLQRSLELRRWLVDTWAAVGRTDLAVTAASGVGDALYRLNQYEDAEAAYVQALDRRDAAGDARGLAEIQNNLGLSRWRQGKMTAARTALEDALRLWRASGDAGGEALTLNNLGIVHRQSGEYDAARSYYRRALTLARRLRDRRGEALALNNNGVVLDSLGRPREALRHLLQAFAMFRTLDDDLAAGRALIAASRIHLGLGRAAAATTAVRQGLALVRAGGDRLAEANGIELFAQALAARGDWPGARVEHDRALALYREIGSRRGESEVHHELGRAALALGDADAAIVSFTAALTLRHDGGLKGLEADTLVQIARAERRRGQPDRARAALEEALDILDRIRAGVFERELRQSFVGSIRTYYEDYVALLVDLHRARPDAALDAVALEAAERARALRLLEHRRGLQVDLPAQADTDLLERERDLRRQINFLSFQLWQRADSGSGRVAAADLESALQRLIADREQVDAEIRRTDPRTARLMPSAPFAVADLRGAIDGNTIVLEFFLGARRSFGWAVTSDAIVVAELPARTEIERRVRSLRREIAAGEDPIARPPEAVARRRQAAASLSRMLLAPFAPLLGRRKVLIVPDGVLHQLPFAALPVPGSATWMSARHDVMQAPSAALFVALGKELAERPRPPRLLAAVGDPVFDRTDPRVRPATAPRAVTASASASAPRVRRVSRLPFSRDEVDQIAALVPASSTLKVVDFGATRALAFSGVLGAFRYLHLATHAMPDDAHPALSGIVLSLVDHHGRPQDGFLRLHDIYGLRLATDLVVLSGCQTAIGADLPGEGVSSLAHGFFYAGSARVMATLWKVDDEATAAMMRAFYHGLLREHRSPAAALRAAQTSMRADPRWSDPYFWSGFVLLGAW
jgi:CHAT domain-containing protein/Flp pilus assembly protein TadD